MKEVIKGGDRNVPQRKVASFDSCSNVKIDWCDGTEFSGRLETAYTQYSELSSISLTVSKVTFTIRFLDSPYTRREVLRHYGSEFLYFEHVVFMMIATALCKADQSIPGQALEMFEKLGTEEMEAK